MRRFVAPSIAAAFILLLGLAGIAFAQPGRFRERVAQLTVTGTATIETAVIETATIAASTATDVTATTADVAALTADEAEIDALTATTADVTTLTVGASGSEVDSLLFGQVQVDNGETSATLSLTGVTASHKIVATINSGNSASRSLIRAVPGTNTVQVILSGDPGANTLVSVLALN